MEIASLHPVAQVFCVIGITIIISILLLAIGGFEIQMKRGKGEGG